MDNLENLKREIEIIKIRNTRVEIEKAWETSWTRKIAIAVLTYIVIVIFFITLSFNKPFINALVPTLGFLLSTLSFSILKNYWLKNIYKKIRRPQND